MSDKYYMNLGGKAMGPYSLEQLVSLRDRGKLTPDSRISTDRRLWKAAATLLQIFPDSAAQPGSRMPQTASTAPAAPKWFFSQGDREQGPVEWSLLVQMAAAGTLNPKDMIWNESLSDWQPAGSVDGLFPRDNAPLHRRVLESKPGRGYQQIASSRFWNGLLGGVRSHITADDLESACRALIHVGNYAVMVAMLVGPAFLLVHAIKVDSIEGVLASIALFFGLAVLKYVALRMSVAVHQIVAASPCRLSSTAFCDSIAVMLLFAAFLGVAAMTFWGIQQNNVAATVGYIILGLQLFISCGYAGCAALHPKWMNVDCSSPVSAGEEGIGVISFLLKLWLRFAPVTFGVGALFGALGFLVALVLLIAGGEHLLTAIACGTYSLTLMIGVCVFPIAAYLIMVLYSILLDLFRSVMVIPEKLDALAQQQHPPNTNP